MSTLPLSTVASECEATKERNKVLETAALAQDNAGRDSTCSQGRRPALEHPGIDR